MKFLEIISGAIGKIWKFATSLIFIGLISILCFFAITVFFPDQIMNAINIFKNLLKIA